MKKRLLSLALAVIMVCALLPITAGAVTVTEITQPKYTYVWDLADGFAKVNVGGDIVYSRVEGGKYGVIDATGKEVIPCQYDKVTDFSEGLIAVGMDTGETMLGDPVYKWSFFDKTVAQVFSCEYDSNVTYAPEFHDGLAAVLDENHKFGFIDKTGKEVVPCKYVASIYAPAFSEGFAAVRGIEGWGIIDKTGKEVVPCTLEYDDVGRFHDGLAAVSIKVDTGERDGAGRHRVETKYGFIDKTGKEVVPCKYDNAGKFDQGLAAVWLRDKGWGFIDTTGKEVIPCKYNYFGYADDTGNYLYPKFHNGVTVIDGSTGQIENGKTVYAPGVIDTQGNVVVPFGKYNEIKRFIDGLAAVRDENYNQGFIDTTGKEVVPIGKYKFDENNISEGLVKVWQDGKCGFIDTTGKEVIPCTLEYDEVGDCSDGLTAVKTSNGWGCIDLQGNEVVPCQYGGVKLRSKGTVAVKLDGKWGILRVEGLPTEPKPVPTPTPTPTPEPTTPDTYTAKATNDKLTVDGVSKAPTAYKINNANYFQLRDVAVLLNDTKAQFSVDYDDAAKAIKITTGQPYQPNGKEMKGAKATAEAIVGNNDVYINGVKTDFAVYKIGGSNFFQIRDLGKALGFNVDWAKDVGIIIDPSKPYSGK